MKKFILALTALFFVCAGAQSQAQDCDAIVQPYFTLNHIDKATYPVDKMEWDCSFSQNAFYFCDTVPAGSQVFYTSELTNVLTGQHAPRDLKVNLNTFSYYQYDFIQFQMKDYHRTIYFALEGNDHAYLAVRHVDAMYERTNHPERFKD